MFFVRDIVARFGFANTLGTLSFIISVTCFAFVARITQHQSKVELSRSEPKIIVANGEKIKIATDKTGGQPVDANVYDNIVSNIDSMSEAEDDSNPIAKAKKAPVIEKANIPPRSLDSAVPKATSGKHLPQQVSQKNILETVKKQQIQNKKNIQLGVFKSHRSAVSAWFKMSDKYSYLSNVRYHVVSKEGNDGQFLYLLQIKPSGPEEATKIHDMLAESGIEASFVD